MRVSWKSALVLALALAAPFASPRAVHAQFGGIGSYSPPKTSRNPAFSPYLNLNRDGAPGINYFGIVRPQMDANRNFQQIEQGTFVDPRLGPNQGMGPDGSVLPGAQNYLPNQAAGLRTGHPATYFYYSHYYQFPNRAGGGGAGSGAGGNMGTFGRPNTQATPFFAGAGGVLLPINPAGADPLGGGLFNGGQYQQQGGQQPMIMP